MEWVHQDVMFRWNTNMKLNVPDIPNGIPSEKLPQWIYEEYANAAETGALSNTNPRRIPKRYDNSPVYPCKHRYQ